MQETQKRTWNMDETWKRPKINYKRHGRDLDESYKRHERDMDDNYKRPGRELEENYKRHGTEL